MSTDLTDLFVVLGETVRELGVGALILIDELQEATAEEMAAVSTAIHQISQTSPVLPLFLVGAGLPSLPSQLATANSYAERLYQFRALSTLSELDSRAALVQPVIERDAEWDEAALRLALDAANGYPYFLQEVGKAVWNNALGRVFTVEDARVGTDVAREEVNAGLYQSRWDRATPAQKDLLRALAEEGEGDGVVVRDLARAMGKPSASALSVPRDELIKKGLVYAPNAASSPSRFPASTSSSATKTELIARCGRGAPRHEGIVASVPAACRPLGCTRLTRPRYRPVWQDDHRHPLCP